MRRLQSVPGCTSGLLSPPMSSPDNAGCVHHLTLVLYMYITLLLHQYAMALQGWYPGERAIHWRKLGFDGPMPQAWTWISGDMPEQHRTFYSRNLHTVNRSHHLIRQHSLSPVVVHSSGQGRQAGLRPQLLERPVSRCGVARVRLRPPVEDIGARMDGEGSPRDRFNVAEIGFDFWTRRRNKFAGFLSEAVRTEGLEFKLRLSVNQAIGYLVHSCLHRRVDGSDITLLGTARRTLMSVNSFPAPIHNLTSSTAC